MTSRWIRILSFTLAIVSFGAMLYANYEIATAYNEADGKTQALFGIIELLRFNHRYFTFIPVTLSILLITGLLKTTKFTAWDIWILLTDLVSIIGLLTPWWRLLI